MQQFKGSFTRIKHVTEMQIFRSFNLLMSLSQDNYGFFPHSIVVREICGDRLHSTNAIQNVTSII